MKLEWKTRRLSSVGDDAKPDSMLCMGREACDEGGFQHSHIVAAFVYVFEPTPGVRYKELEKALWGWLKDYPKIGWET